MAERSPLTCDDVGLRADAFDALPGQTAVLDGDGEILTTNTAWRAFASENGVDQPTAIHGENYLRAVKQDSDGAAAAAGIRDVLSGARDEYEREYPCHTPEAERWFVMRVLAFERGSRRHAVVLHTDVTDRRQAEADEAARNDQLEAVASILSHDLKNPLTVALGRVELLEGEQARVVEDTLERMGTMVDDALALARMDAVEDPGTVDLGASARAAWDHVATDGATLTVESSVVFPAEESLLGHLFENLFRNAIDHAGPTTTVTVGRLSNGFYVADDGPGIPAEDRRGIFELGTTMAEDGTGIGLAVVKRVAEMHGWSVSVTESADGGARFDVTGVPVE